MKQMGSDKGQDTTERTTSTEFKESIAQVGLVSKDESSTVDKQLGRLVIDDTRSYYVSNKLWANLTNEVSNTWANMVTVHGELIAVEIDRRTQRLAL